MDAFILFLQQRVNPPVLPGEIKNFSKNKIAEINARGNSWRKNNHMTEKKKCRLPCVKGAVTK